MFIQIYICWITTDAPLSILSGFHSTFPLKHLLLGSNSVPQNGCWLGKPNIKVGLKARNMGSTDIYSNHGCSQHPQDHPYVRLLSRFLVQHRPRPGWESPSTSRSSSSGSSGNRCCCCCCCCCSCSCSCSWIASLLRSNGIRISIVEVAVALGTIV